MKSLVMIAFVLVFLSAAQAEVVDQAANGFTSKHVVTLQAPPDTVYQRLITVGNWWSSDHTFSGNAHNLTLEAKPMGCWCEKLPNGGGVRHMEVVNVMPGKLLVVNGGLGPLQSMAAIGSMTFRLSPQQGGTRLEVTYAVGGYFPAGTKELSGGVDSVLTQQFARFKNYVETGNAAAAPKR